MAFDSFSYHPVIKSIDDDGRYKAALCKCGQKAIYMACMPIANTMDELVKQFVAHNKDGREIIIVNKPMQICQNESICQNKVEPFKQISEIVEKHPKKQNPPQNQTSLF